MSLKDTIEQWSQGVDKALEGRFEEAIDVWSSMQEPGAKIHFNIASMYLLLGRLDNAERNLDLCVQKDAHLALAYFQRGCIHLKKERFYEALKDLDAALKNLRGNTLIDYKQLGLQYKLYSCEIMYNHAYGLYYMGRLAEGKEELERAKAIASSSSESRHKIIVAALDYIKLGTKFEAYKLPDKAMIFQPPRNKTEVLKPVNFLGKAKVLSSVVDQDSYVGFVGVQEEKQRRTPSPRPARSHRDAPPSGKPAKSATPARLPKPDLPPPAPEMLIRRRSSSLQKNPGSTNKPPPAVLAEFKKVNVQTRPPKPNMAPPPLSSEKPKAPMKQTKSLDNPGGKPNRKPPTGPAKTPGMMTVKVHYSTTRAVRVSSSITYQQLQLLICKKFDRPEGSLTLWCKKKTGELNEIDSEAALKEVSASPDDGFRITVWAYDKHEESCEELSDDEDPVLLECVATHNYTGQYEDELSFSIGDTVEVTADINSDWYEGRCNGLAGIFPKSYVKVA